MPPTIFEQIKKINDAGFEYWSARELAKALEYSEYRHFLAVVEKAKIAAETSGFEVSDHFEDVLEMISIGTGTVREALREVESINMSRYACYLVVQNADSSKPIVAKAQTYFAIQTRRQEKHDELIEDSKRVMLRDEMKQHNKNLANTAKSVGVTNFGNFQDFGYIGLYGGLRQKDIHKKKGLKDKDKILDHMGSEELAANLFRATQAAAKLNRDNIRGQASASSAHFEVGRKVRATIQELGGTMPEQLPTAEHIKESQKRVKGLPTKNLPKRKK